MGLRIKRQYVLRDGAVERILPVIDVKHASPVQHFSPEFVAGGAGEGWLSLTRGQLILHTPDGRDDVAYHLVRSPGGYCCHCDAPVDIATTVDANGLTPGARHVVEHHKGVVSPDPSNPCGYRGEAYFTAVLVGSPIDRQTPDERVKAEKDVRTALIQKSKGKFIRPIAGGANVVFNIAKGRAAELYNRVDLNDPANSGLVVLLLASSGIESDATLIDKDEITALVSGTTNEATNTGYARKLLSDSDVVAFAPDDTNDRVDIDIPDQTWGGVANDNTGAIGDLVVAYDNDITGGVADNLIVPLTLHDFIVTPDGSDITAQIATAGFFRAS